VQDTLPAHLAIKNGALAEPFHLNKEPITPRAGSQPAPEGFQNDVSGIVETLKEMRVILQTAKHAINL
jgi:hypothetical protein